MYWYSQCSRHWEVVKQIKRELGAHGAAQIAQLSAGPDFQGLEWAVSTVFISTANRIALVLNMKLHSLRSGSGMFDYS